MTHPARQTPLRPTFGRTPLHTFSAACVLAAVTVGSTAGAQDAPSVTVSPSVIVVDHSTHTGHARFINTTGDTVTADLTLQYGPMVDPPERPQRPGGPASAADSAKFKKDLARFLKDSVKFLKDSVQFVKIAEKNESMAEVWGLNGWIANFPGQLSFAAHETTTVDFKLNVPKGVQPGEYSAYVIVHSAAAPAAPAPAGGGNGGAPGPRRRRMGGGGGDDSAVDTRPVAVTRLLYRTGRK